MKPSSTASRFFDFFTVAAVFLALVGSPIKTIGRDGSGCACAGKEIPQAAFAGCCARECHPVSTAGERFIGIDTIRGGGKQPLCCHAVPDPLRPASHTFIFQDTRRPLFPDLPFQQFLSSTVMFPFDRHIPACVSAFDRDMIRLAPHISSTVLLL